MSRHDLVWYLAHRNDPPPAPWRKWMFPVVAIVVAVIYAVLLGRLVA